MKTIDFKPNKKTYYILPTNSLGLVNCNINLTLCKNKFSSIEATIDKTLKSLNITNLLGQNYLPIGSSIIIDYDNDESIVISPIMLSNQNISKTNNIYYFTMSILHNILINKKENIEDIDIIFTSLICCYNKDDNEESINQIIKGFKNYHLYKPLIVSNNIIIHKLTLSEQQKKI